MSLQGFETRIVKHVPSRCTGSAIPAQKKCVVNINVRGILLKRISRYIDMRKGSLRIAMCPRICWGDKE